MPPDPPVPVLATFAPGPRLLTITFDRPLQPAPLGPLQLTCRCMALVYNQPLAGNILGQVVTATMKNPIANPGPNECSYAALPPDVVSAKGVPAAPFAAYPLT